MALAATKKLCTNFNVPLCPRVGEFNLIVLHPHVDLRGIRRRQHNLSARLSAMERAAALPAAPVPVVPAPVAPAPVAPAPGAPAPVAPAPVAPMAPAAALPEPSMALLLQRLTVLEVSNTRLQGKVWMLENAVFDKAPATTSG